MKLRSAVLLATCLAAVAAAALWTVSQGTRRTASAFRKGSVFDESPDGLSLALRYLRERERSVDVLQRRVSRGRLPPDAVLFRVRPRRLPFPATSQELLDKLDEPADKPAGSGATPKPAQRPAIRPLLTETEEAWVRGGGRLVLGLDDGYGPLTLATRSRPEAVRKVFPALPGVRRLEPGESIGVASGLPLESASTLFACGDVAAVARLALGRGEVLLLTVPQVLENARLGAADHLRLLETLAGAGRPVVFDEWAHGYGEDPGLFVQLLEWGFGPSLATGAMAFALLLWRGRTRVGPPEAEPPESRSEAVDLVDSLAQLYGRALTRRDALAMHLDGLRATVSMRSGLRGEALERRVRELVQGALPSLAGEGDLAPSQFLRGLHAVNEGYRRLREHADTRRGA